MFTNRSDQLAHQETTCDLLLKELQEIWDEVGESDAQRDATLLEIEQMCMDLFRKKVDEAKKCRAQLQQAIADSEAEIADICSAMGEQPVHFDRKSSGSLKKGHESVMSQLEEMRKLKSERKNQFLEILYQLQNISTELYGNKGINGYMDENNLSLKRMEELQRELVELQIEKASRLKRVSDLLNSLRSLCSVFGLEFEHKVHEIHPNMVDSTGTKDISDQTIKKLTSEVQILREVKIQRMQKLQNLAASLLEMWNMMDTPVEEQKKYHSVTSKIAATESELSEPNELSIDSIVYVEAEVRRLEELKSTKMEKLVLRKKLELEEICKSTHLTAQAVFPSEYLEVANPEYLLEQIEHEIMKIKEEALSRKEILEKVEKWMAASQEESWLEEYNRDDNRYNASRGAHLTLKRAEKARVLVNKIPGMVEALTSKITAWEKEKGFGFLYDGSRLLSMLEDYSTLRQEKEDEKQRQRDQKRLQGQLMAKHETLFGTNLSPSKGAEKAPRCSTGFPSSRKFSIAGAMLQDSKTEKAAPILQSNRKGNFSNQNSFIVKNAAYATPSAGKDASKVAGHLIKKTPYNKEKETGNQSTPIRKPLSPVSSRVLSKSNIAGLEEEQRNSQKGFKSQDISSQMLTRTPSKPITIGDEENRTPKNMGIPVSSTPSSTSVPMLTVFTPETPAVYSGFIDVAKTAEHVEYSFEEVRNSFLQEKAYFQ